METIPVRIRREDRKYPIFTGEGALKGISSFIQKNHPSRRIALISDKKAHSLFGKKIISLLPSKDITQIIIPSGEKSKTRKTKEWVEDELLLKGFARDTLLIALGGGVVTDLAGFVASTYYRGVPIIHVPTTLLCMADASVGGKTGVDTPDGKNLIGTIFQPDAVFADISFLSGLPLEEFLCGISEIVKIALTSDHKLFSFIEKNAVGILGRDPSALEHILIRAIALKRDIVATDEEEGGLRQILNLGHTVGHAVESCSAYKIRHGFCVSIGIAAEIRISRMKGYLSLAEERRILSLLNTLKLPIRTPKNLKEDDLLMSMRIDKKSIKNAPHIVLLRTIGSIARVGEKFSFPVEESILRTAIRACRDD